MQFTGKLAVRHSIGLGLCSAGASIVMMCTAAGGFFEMVKDHCTTNVWVWLFIITWTIMFLVLDATSALMFRMAFLTFSGRRSTITLIGDLRVRLRTFR